MTEFSRLGLSPATLQAVADTGYTEATPIQAQAIPVALAGRDVLGIAQTGTGKTAAFTLPMIDRLVAGRSKARMPRSLVIAPTRELADQVALSFERYSKGQKLSWALLIGGVSFGDQETKLDRGVDVLIATPGRLLDHFERGKLLLTGVQIMVVDEADRMLDMGFIPDIERIFKLTPPGRQTLFFSATMPPEITRLTRQFLKDPVRIEVSRPASTAEGILQHVARVPSADPAVKRLALRALVGSADVKNGIVFCNRKSEVDVVARSLRKHGFDALAIHGDLEQSQRTRTLEAFRKGELKLLVASDVAARGLDIPDVSHIFNFDVPHHADDYVHRVGRTGRAGKTGISITLVSPADGRDLDKVIRLIGKTPQEIPLDLDWSQASTDGRAPDRKRRERRDRGFGRPASETSVALMEPLTPTPRRDAPVDDAEAATTAQAAATHVDRPVRGRPERRNGSRHASKDDPSDAPAVAVRVQPSRAEPRRAERQRDDAGRPARAESRRPARQGDDEDRRVFGFGDEAPAFLARK
jgi:superfamily II DNA/RNA helicase